jgi:hypothetical protein
VSNTDIWKKFSRPPESALKPIMAGRLSGKTDINPQWRLLAMTEAFGPCGIGWKYQIDKVWTDVGSDGVVFSFVQISVFIKQDGQWSDAIPGIGGNKLIDKERSGLHSNDEAHKMALTDALSVAFKALGVAADIYSGQWDGKQYAKGKDEGKDAVVEYDDMDEAARECVDAIRHSDNVEKLYELGVKLRNEPKELQAVALPYYREMWVKFFKSASTNADLDAMGVVLSKESKDVVTKEFRDTWAAKKKEFAKAASTKK